MLRKYLSLYTGICLVTYLGFYLFYNGDILGSWFGFLILLISLIMPFGFILMFFLERNYSLKQRFITCALCFIVSLLIFYFTQSTDYLEHNSESLSEGLGFALVYVFFVFYINIGLPVIMLLGTVLKSIIFIIKEKRKNGDTQSVSRLH